MEHPKFYVPYFFLEKSRFSELVQFAICYYNFKSLPPPSHLRDGSACPGSRTSTSGQLSGSTGPASQSPGKPRARRRPPLSSSDAGHTNTPTPIKTSLSIKKKKWNSATGEAEKLQSGYRENPVTVQVVVMCRPYGRVWILGRNIGSAGTAVVCAWSA